MHVQYGCLNSTNPHRVLTHTDKLFLYVPIDYVNYDYVARVLYDITAKVNEQIKVASLSVFPMHATSPARIIVLDLIIQIFDEKYKF
jgi:hypothetical protein